MLFEEFGVFYRGLVLGLMIAAPVGPIGLLCIRRTIQNGLLVGFATGLGTAVADAIFGAIAVFGVAAILDFIHHYNNTLRLLGGAFLLFIAWHTWHDPPRAPNEQKSSAGGTLAALVSSFALTMTNPVTVLATIAVIATLGSINSSAEALTMIAGIFSGSALWWLILSGGISLVRHHFNESRVRVINRITGVVLAAIAVWVLAGSVMAVVGAG